MEAVYHCHINELSEDFFKSPKKQFSNALVDIVIKDIDETDYFIAINIDLFRLSKVYYQLG